MSYSINGADTLIFAGWIDCVLLPLQNMAVVLWKQLSQSKLQFAIPWNPGLEPKLTVARRVNGE